MPKDYLSDDEINLFRNSVLDVKPLKHKSKNVYKEQTTVNIRKHPIRIEEPQPIYIEKKYPLINSEETILFKRSGISKSQLLDLKNAKNRYKSALDLHGLSPENAATNLISFIKYQHQINNKIILIIHGKSGKHHSPPVIKNLVNNLLRQIPEVLAFHSAKPGDGGTGAVYVLLKSNKNF